MSLLHFPIVGSVPINDITNKTNVSLNTDGKTPPEYILGD